LVAEVAQAYPSCLILLIGHDQIGAGRRLRHIANVRLLGEVPYRQLPYYLHGFDVCLLPRRILPLTKAMNPVKVYEYLSAGRPVVAVDLPELQQFGDLVYNASSPAAFLDSVGTALAESRTAAIVAQRRDFAARETWAKRAARVIAVAEAIELPSADSQP
jgi:glycosyltransferase involved in cell wall biosynthesis